MYKTVSESYIQSILNKSLFEQLYHPCYNLSAMLGDKDGFMPVSCADKIISSIALTPPGIVSISIVADEVSSAIPKEEYIRDISSQSFTLFNEIVNGVSKALYPDLGTRVSPILEELHRLSPALRTAISVLYLESFVIYYDLLSATTYTGMANMNRADLDRILNNIRWISNTLEDNLNGMYDLIAMIRDLYRTITYVRSLNILFDDTYVKRLSELEGGAL